MYHLLWYLVSIVSYHHHSTFLICYWHSSGCSFWLITTLLPSSTTLRSPLKTTRVFILCNQVTSQTFSRWNKQIKLLKPLWVKALSSALKSVWEFLPHRLLLEELNALLIFNTQLSDYFHTPIPVSEKCTKQHHPLLLLTLRFLPAIPESTPRAAHGVLLSCPAAPQEQQSLS